MGYIYLSLILLLGLLTGQSVGQSSSPAATAATPQFCNESASMAIDINKISGTWYELATNPAPKGNYLCAEVNLVPSNGLNFSITYSNTPTYPWVNYTMYTNVTMQEINNTAGFNLSLSMYGVSYPMTTYKVLDTNYVNYTFVCGYRNISDFSTYFATILTRDRFLNSSILNNYETMAQANYSLFSNTSMMTIEQTAGCSESDGVLTVQMISFLMVLMYAGVSVFC